MSNSTLIDFNNCMSTYTGRGTRLGARILAVLLGSAALVPFAYSEPEESPSNLNEIVVTAEKRTETLQQVPMGITVLDGASLVEQNYNKLEDYVKSVPGLSLEPQGDGTQLLIIRGVSLGRGTNPTIGVTIDDVPIGSTVAVGDGDINVLDLDPSDTDSIQVLKGPQGTLYGASSMGGLLKYVTRNPSLDQTSGYVESDLSSVYNGNVGYGVRGQVNIPIITDVLAVSVSGHVRRDPGYIDIPAQSKTDANQSNYDGGRITVLWHPSDTLSIKLGAIMQTSTGNAISTFNTTYNLSPTIGDLKQESLLGSGHFYNRNLLYTANIDFDLGFANLTSITGYGASSYDAGIDFARLAPTFDQLYGYDGAITFNSYGMKKITEELRLASKTGSELEWLVGGFFTREDNESTQDFFPVNPLTGAIVPPTVGLSVFPLLYKEAAVFADVTYHINERWKVQVGARYAENRQAYTETDSGDFFGSDYIHATSADHALTHLLTTSFDIEPNVTVYGRLASGYRPGGPNPYSELGAPATYKADTTENYEIGLKGSAFERRLSFDADIFYIDWKNIQQGLIDPTNYFEYLINAGKARSQGLEASVQAEPWHGLTISANVAVTDATLRENLPLNGTAVGMAGDRLPNSSKYTGLVGIEKRVTLNDHWTAFGGGDVSYTGNKETVFTAEGVPRLTIPAYTTEDLHLGARHDEWTITAFLNNVSDKRGIVTADVYTGSGGPASTYIAYPITPRTAGISVVKKF